MGTTADPKPVEVSLSAEELPAEQLQTLHQAEYHPHPAHLETRETSPAW
jgi:hypothetical protein